MILFILHRLAVQGGSNAGSENKSFKKAVNTDGLLYFQAIQKRNQRDYAGAINKCKELIDIP